MGHRRSVGGNEEWSEHLDGSRWLNQVERFIGFVSADLLQRSDPRSVQALEADIRKWVKAWKENPTPFTWTKTAEQILESLGRLLKRTTGAGR